MAPSLASGTDQLTPPASLAHLTESNAPPSILESNLVIAYIDELESQIASLDATPESNPRRRANLLHAVKTHKSILSPIRRLPPEILGEIFCFVLYATFYFGDISHVLPPVSRHAPWLFTRICRHWSAVALASPTLWSMVFLDLDRVGERGAVPMTELCLQRSLNVPLTVKIFRERDPGDSNLVLDVVMASSDRWKIADVYMGFPLLQQIGTLHGRLSALSTLLISLDFTEFEFDVDERFWKGLEIAPQLTTLVAHSWDLYHFLPAPFSLPWHQLTRLSTTFTTTTEALYTLQNLSDIIECKLAFSRAGVLPSDLSLKIHLPHLRFLALQIEQDPDTADPPETSQQKYSSLLDFLETPCLQTLATHDTADEESVLGLVTRSDCAAFLKSFHFHSSSINQSAILRLIQKMPRLISLQIGHFNENLLTQSFSLPAFISTFWRQWLKQKEECVGAERRLSVRITNQTYLDNMSVDIAKMQKDGLFVSVFARSSPRSIISDPFC